MTTFLEGMQQDLEALLPDEAETIVAHAREVRRSFMGSDRETRFKAARYAVIALAAGAAYSIVRNAGLSDIGACETAGNVVALAAQAVNGCRSDRLAAQVLARIAPQLSRYGINQKRGALNEEDILTVRGLNSWADAHGIPVYEPAYER